MMRTPPASGSRTPAGCPHANQAGSPPPRPPHHQLSHAAARVYGRRDDYPHSSHPATSLGGRSLAAGGRSTGDGIFIKRSCLDLCQRARRCRRGGENPSRHLPRSVLASASGRTRERERPRGHGELRHCLLRPILRRRRLRRLGRRKISPPARRLVEGANSWSRLCQRLHANCRDDPPAHPRPNPPAKVLLHRFQIDHSQSFSGWGS